MTPIPKAYEYWGSLHSVLPLRHFMSWDLELARLPTPTSTLVSKACHFLAPQSLLARFVHEVENLKPLSLSGGFTHPPDSIKSHNSPTQRHDSRKMCEWEAWKHSCGHTVYQRLRSYFKQHCKQPKDTGFKSVYETKYQYRCRRCGPADSSHLSEFDRMGVGGRVVHLNNWVWEQLWVEGDKERWERWWMGLHLTN
jgi:hypothetical protein